MFRIMKPRVGISACLLGERLRYDGDHRRQAFVSSLGEHFQWVPVCPEFEAGFGVPREKMRLEESSTRSAAEGGSGLRLVTISSRQDVTGRLRSWMLPALERLEAAGLSGFILQSGSPSCGTTGVKVFDSRPGDSPDSDSTARWRPEGVGLFAQALRERFPHLPLAEETLLADPRRQELFVHRVRAYAGGRIAQCGASNEERRMKSAEYGASSEERRMRSAE